jgi:hypothetical protein
MSNQLIQEREIASTEAADSTGNESVVNQVTSWLGKPEV